MSDARDTLLVDAAVNDDDVRTFYELPEDIAHAVRVMAGGGGPDDTFAFDQSLASVLETMRTVVGMFPDTRAMEADMRTFVVRAREAESKLSRLEAAARELIRSIDQDHDVARVGLDAEDVTYTEFTGQKADVLRAALGEGEGE
jgi:hypothetical protein